MNNQDKLLNLPIYQKAELIFDLVNSLMNAINEDDECDFKCIDSRSVGC